MNILAIETSCDETAVCIVKCEGDPTQNTFEMKVLGNAIHSQIANHEAFGGVVPMLAKREHAKKLIPLLKQVLKESGIDSGLRCHWNDNTEGVSSRLHGNAKTKEEIEQKITELFGREEEFKNDFLEFIEEIKIQSQHPSNPDSAGSPTGSASEEGKIDAIAVTQGPGLEPALWMGIIFAEALSYVFNIPLIPVNHMEGHIMSVLPAHIEFPALSLLISGGHTELVLMRDWYSYETIGQTRDDAVGEAYDKVARMLGLPYPGGPEISRLAECQRSTFLFNTTTKTSTVPYILPRPMIKSPDYDFSFSGLKTAVLYSLKHNDVPKEIVAKEFEDAVTEVLITKTLKAVDEYAIKTVIIGGGVISNSFISDQFKKALEPYAEVTLLIPNPDKRTDNALMIATAGYIRYLHDTSSKTALRAQGNLTLT